MRRELLKDLQLYFREYCTRSSVHGFQYFGEKKRHIFERIWWILMFLICLSACIFTIYAVYRKWEDSPVIVNFANKGTPIYEIPFPSVTICPESKFNQKKFNFTEILQKKENGKDLNKTEKTQFEYLSVICNYYDHLSSSNNKRFSDNFFQVLDKIKPDFMLTDCLFLGIPSDCNDFVSVILTDEGICYSFNILDRTQIFRDNTVHFMGYHKILEPMINQTSWTLENGYSQDSGLEPYPFRAYLAGATYGLSFNLETRLENLDYSCRDSLQGYKISLHTPTAIPRPSQKYFNVPLNQKVIASVQPTMITTSKRIKAYDPERRQCYFSGERCLKFFNTYTSSNCNLECSTNYTLALCGCVDFYMPRENGTEICGSGSTLCVKRAIEKMQVTNLRIKLDTGFYSSLEACNCLPVCSDLSYEVETSQTDFFWMEMYRARPNLRKLKNISHLSSVTIFFKSDNFITSERNELYGPLDFLANFGGILGLFTGFSILSLMEILYFLSIRIICNLRLFGRWAGQGN